MSVLDVVARRPLLRAAAVSALFGFAWSFLHVGVFARELTKLNQDVSLYQGWGDAVRGGAVPYRDVVIAYPPGALPAFIAPAFASNYGVVFELLMLVCGLVAAFLIGRTVSGWAALLLVGLWPLLVGDLMRARYDLWPAALTTAAMVAFIHDRHRVGWALLAAAVTAKGYALCLCPLAAVWTARRAGTAELRRAAVIGGAVLLAAVAPFVVIAPHGLWQTISSQFNRPLEFESLGGSILMTARRASTSFSDGSINVLGTPAHVLALASSVVEFAALVWCWLGFARGEADRARFCRYAAASICAFVAFGKVLSPQYLIWLVPIVAFVRGRIGLAAIGLTVTACLLMQWEFPGRYVNYALDRDATVWIVLGRNLVLVALFALLAWPYGRHDLRERLERERVLAPGVAAG